MVDHFDLSREVVSIAMSHMDRYLGVYEGTVDRTLFQLLAMTCLHLSIKLNEYKQPILSGSTSSMDTILRLGRGLVDLEDMERMELDVLSRLRWHVHPPTPQVFSKDVLSLLLEFGNNEGTGDVERRREEIHELQDLSEFAIELCAMDYFFVSRKPSEVAIAALWNAADKLSGNHNNNETAAKMAWLLGGGFPFAQTQISRFFDLDSPGVRACRDRLAVIYEREFEEPHEPIADSEASEAPVGGTEPTKVPADDCEQPPRSKRTISSPVSVAAHPDEPNDENSNGNSSPSSPQQQPPLRQ